MALVTLNHLYIVFVGSSLLVDDFRRCFAYADGMGEMRRAIAREQEERRTQDRFASTLIISASIIAAVRLAHEDVATPSPRVITAIGDSIQLARMILKRVVGS